MKKSLLILFATCALPILSWCQPITIDGTASINSEPTANLFIELEMFSSYNSQEPDTIWSAISNENGEYSIIGNFTNFIDSAIVQIVGCPFSRIIFFNGQQATLDFNLNCTVEENYEVYIGASPQFGDLTQWLFTSNHYGLATSYEWTIEGNTFNDPDILYQFDSEGEYVVELAVTFEDGEVGSAQLEIEANNASGCQAYFFAIPDASNPGNLTLVNSSMGLGLSYFLWDFGDGTSSGEQYPTHFYEDGEQEYEICLIVANAFCTDTICNTVTGLDGFGIAPFPDSESEQGYSNVQGLAKSNGFTVNVIPVQSDILTISDLHEMPGFKLYPNPITDQISIDLSGIDAISRVKIVDINGRILYNLVPAQNTDIGILSIDLDALSEGIYILQLENSMGSASTKFVKSR